MLYFIEVQFGTPISNIIVSPIFVQVVQQVKAKFVADTLRPKR